MNQTHEKLTVKIENCDSFVIWAFTSTKVGKAESNVDKCCAKFQLQRRKLGLHEIRSRIRDVSWVFHALSKLSSLETADYFFERILILESKLVLLNIDEKKTPHTPSQEHKKIHHTKQRMREISDIQRIEEKNQPATYIQI